MRRAFVLQMAGRGQTSFEGRVEHIDSGHARRFRSLDEFLRFIEQMLADYNDSDRGDQNQLFTQSGSDEITSHPLNSPNKQEQRAGGTS